MKKLSPQELAWGFDTFLCRTRCGAELEMGYDPYAICADDVTLLICTKAADVSTRVRMSIEEFNKMLKNLNTFAEKLQQFKEATQKKGGKTDVG